jgi:hypothetical protein
MICLERKWRRSHSSDEMGIALAVLESLALDDPSFQSKLVYTLQENFGMASGA